jgi:hypothetical protein
MGALVAIVSWLAFFLTARMIVNRAVGIAARRRARRRAPCSCGSPWCPSAVPSTAAEAARREAEAVASEEAAIGRAQARQ